MKSIKSRNTKPEVFLRKFLYSKGLRYRINYKKLPGKPDIVLVSRKLAIFVHGCFWHQHKNCEITNIPKSNSEFWYNKFKINTKRDVKNRKEIETLGWKSLVIWECEILDKNRKRRNLNKISRKIDRLCKVY